MVGPPENPSTTVGRRWLWAVRLAALACLLLLVPVIVSASFGGFGYAFLVGLAVLLVPAAVTALLYVFTLWRFPGKTLRNGLALATVTGVLGVLFGLFCLSLVLRVWTTAVYIMGAFLLTNVILVATAIKVYWGGRRPEGERPSRLGATVAAGACLGPIVLFALLELFVAQPYHEYERLAEQAVGDARWARYEVKRVNTAARNHVERYHNGYPPSLSAFGPPLSGGGSNCNHAGFLLQEDAVVTGEFTFEWKRYKFEYRAGAPVLRPIPGCNPGVQSYTLTARPLPYVSSSWITHRKVVGESFFTDETGVIRYTDEDRLATAQDSPL